MYHGCKINQTIRQAIFGQMEGMPPKGGKMGETLICQKWWKSLNSKQGMSWGEGKCKISKSLWKVLKLTKC